MLNRARFYERVEFKDQESKEQTALGKTTTLFGTEALKHKFDRLAEMAKNSEDIRLQELETCQAFKWPPSAEEAAASAGLVKGCLKALSSASGGRRRTSPNGPSSSHPKSTQQKKQKQSREASTCDALFLRECFAVDCSKVLHVCAP